jgi:DNA-directed RNA polymerase subunit RPC12/RpoP
MPIRTDCSSCGKKLRIRDDYIGRRVKCPQCGSAFLAEAVANTAIQAETPKPAPVKTMKDKVAAKPMAKKQPPPDDQEDEDIEERPVKRGKKSKKGEPKKIKPLWIGVAAAVALVAVLVGCYLLFFSGSPKKTVPVAQKRARQVAQQREVALADLVPGDAWFFISTADVPDVPGMENVKQMAKPFEDEFQKSMGFPLSDLERWSAFPLADFAAFKNPPFPPIAVVFETKKPMEQQTVTKAIVNGDWGKRAKLNAEFVTEQMVLVTPAAAAPAYKAKKGKLKATGVLERALSQVATHKGMVACAVVPPELAKEAEGAFKDLPAFLKTKALFLAVDVGDRIVLNGSLVADDPASAQEIKTATDGLVGLASLFLNQNAKNPEMASMVKMGQQALKDLKLAVQDKEMTLAFEMKTADAVGVVMGSLGPAIEKLRGSAANASDLNNLRQIGLAWHNYFGTFKTFPPQTFKNGLSWRVALLPFIEQENLYRQFKLDEPWDSPHNLKLLPLMPKVYESNVAKAGPGRTFYQTFVGPNTVNKNVKQGLKITEIPDGTSNTLIVAESSRAVEWTKPEDITITPNGPVAVGNAEPAHFFAVFADGSVRRLPRNLPEQTLRWLIDPADGNPIPNLGEAK